MRSSFRQSKTIYLLSIVAFCLIVGEVTQAKPPEFLIQKDDVVRGDPKAPITMLEYSDFTCGFCEKFFHETFPQLLSEYIETGKVRFVYRDFPRSPGGPAGAGSGPGRAQHGDERTDDLVAGKGTGARTSNPSYVGRLGSQPT